METNKHSGEVRYSNQKLYFGKPLKHIRVYIKSRSFKKENIIEEFKKRAEVIHRCVRDIPEKKKVLEERLYHDFKYCQEALPPEDKRIEEINKTYGEFLKNVRANL